MILVTEALVLSTQTVAEKDVLLLMLSPRFGRLSAVAKGGKKSKRRFVNALEPFSHLRVHLRGNKIGLCPFLDQADLLNPFEGLRLSPLKFALASYFCELIEIFFRPGTGKEFFPDLLESLALLEETEKYWPLLKLHFELTLLARSGFLPHLSSCARCGRELSKAVSFSYTAGGVVCLICAEENDIRLSPETLAFLRHLTRLSAQNLNRLRPSAENLRQARQAIEKFLLFVVDREINSLRILKEML